MSQNTGFSFQYDEKAAESAGQAGISTGVYKCKVLGFELKTDKSGNPRGDLYLEEIGTGNRAIIFGLLMAPKWKTGKDNLEWKKVSELAKIIGLKTGATATQRLEVKKGIFEDRVCFSEVVGAVANFAIQEKLSVYQNKESKDKSLARTFYKDGLSISEKAIGDEAKQIEYLRTHIKPYETKSYIEWKENGGKQTEEISEEMATDYSAAADLV